MLNAETKEVSCFLEDYFASDPNNAWEFNEKIEDDVLLGMTLIFNKPIPAA